jgi:hypothetical protein
MLFLSDKQFCSPSRASLNCTLWQFGVGFHNPGEDSFPVPANRFTHHNRKQKLTNPNRIFSAGSRRLEEDKRDALIKLLSEKTVHKQKKTEYLFPVSTLIFHTQSSTIFLRLPYKTEKN